ncbi:hypothetical protein Tco_1539635 [Tanacetum coccineum]
MAFVSSPSSTNEVNTAYGVSTANTQVSPASTQVSTATYVDDTNLCIFLDRKQMGLNLYMRTLNKSMKMTLKRWIEVAVSIVEHEDKKIRHFARECRGPRNQDSRNRNQDSSRRTINVEEVSSKVMLAINGAGFD